MFKKFILLVGLVASLNAEVVSGKIDYIQASIDHEAIYFKLKNTPTNITTGYFYLTPFSGTYNGCESKSSKDSMSNAYSALLMAHASSKEVTLFYCTTNNGYGLVNSAIRIK